MAQTVNNPTAVRIFMKSEDDSEEFPMRKTRRSVSWAEELDLLHEIPFESDEIPDDDRGWK